MITMMHNISCKNVTTYITIQLQTLNAVENVLTLGEVVLSCLVPKELKEISEVLESCQPENL